VCAEAVWSTAIRETIEALALSWVGERGGGGHAVRMRDGRNCLGIVHGDVALAITTLKLVILLLQCQFVIASEILSFQLQRTISATVLLNDLKKFKQFNFIVSAMIITHKLVQTQVACKGLVFLDSCVLDTAP
jgi:hypothetical protein